MSLESFIGAYMECAVWSSTDFDGNPLDEIEGDLSEQAIGAMRTDATAFYEECEPTWRDRWTDEQAGHDFWLTRNGHGAGFWDRDVEGPICEELTRAAKAWGSADLYIGDDGDIYHG